MDLVSSSQKISFFEMVAWDSLYSYFEGGFKYVYSVVTGHYDSLVPYQYYSDEAYLVFDLLLESYYLNKYNWLYSENFFSFTRSAISFSNNGLTPFTTKHKVLAIFFEVVLPYLRWKLNKWYQKKLREPGTLPFDEKYLKIIPILNATYSSFDFLYKLKFLLQQDFRFFKVYLHFWNLLIRRKNNFELKREDEMNQNSVMGILSKYNVFVMFLFVKYCQWYFSQSNVNQSTAASDEICPPPKIKKYGKSCPICKKPKVENPWALETSGYVFCFVCIQEYVEKNGKCPVTSIKSSNTNIRKIYT